MTVADIAIWSVLYPLYGDCILKEFLNGYRNVTRWLSDLGSLKQFQVVTNYKKIIFDTHLFYFVRMQQQNIKLLVLNRIISFLIM